MMAAACPPGTAKPAREEARASGSAAAAGPSFSPDGSSPSRCCRTADSTASCRPAEAAPAPDVAVTRTAAWAKATMDNWGLGGLAGDVSLIVAEFSSNAWTHGSPPVEVTLLLQERRPDCRGQRRRGRPGGVRRAPPARRGRPRPPRRRRRRPAGRNRPRGLGYKSVGTAALPVGTRPDRARGHSRLTGHRPAPGRMPVRQPQLGPTSPAQARRRPRVTGQRPATFDLKRVATRYV